MNEQMNELIGKVEEWATERNLHTASPQGQTLKVIEEFTEMLIADGNDNFAETVDGIGDTFVTVIILCQQLKMNFKDILNGFDVLYPKGIKVTWEDDVYSSLNGLSTGVAKGNNKLVEYSIIGILRVVSSIIKKLSDKKDVSYVYCLTTAYDEIKDRKGKMVDGVFIKESDLPSN